MNSAFNDKQAGKGAGQLARRALRAALACALVFGASGAALAQQHGERDDGANYGGGPYGNGQPQGERHGERFRLPQMNDPRQQEAPTRGYDDPRRMQSYPQQQGYPQGGYPKSAPDEQRRGGGRSMTADERAEMRRQINEAKDFYPQRR